VLNPYVSVRKSKDIYMYDGTVLPTLKMITEKRGLLIVMTILISIKFVIAGYCTDPTLPAELYCVPDSTADMCPGFYSDTAPAECDLGCCYPDCIEGTYRGLCSGQFADTCAQIPGNLCVRGCCCWEEQVTQSDILTRGRCIDLSGTFDETIILSEDCSDECGTGSVTPPPVNATPECDDQLDNDNDGLTDLSDPGCLNAHDDSETNPNVQCDDGEDNDLDGGIDADDSCCTDYPDKSEDFCDLDACTLTGQISSQVEACRCRDSYRCAGGQFCCLYGCYDVPCGADNCVSGSRKSCGNFSGNCELFQVCNNGLWEIECKPDPSCNMPFEICTDGLDNNNDGNIDCMDVQCHGQECEPAESSCAQRGYMDEVNQIRVCCYTGNMNDCDGNSIDDTCGECDCQLRMNAPHITSLEKDQGASDVTLRWGLNCDVDMYIYRCVKGNTNCESLSDFTRVTDALRAWEFIDLDIDPGNDYCYMVQADYGTGSVNSESQCLSSGDLACMQMTTTEFCLNDTLGTGGKRVIRARCNNNQVEEIENCVSTYGIDYICMGPYPAEGTKCEYQSDCDDCGKPLSMFADFVNSRATYYDPRTGSEFDMYCREIPTCYYDFSDTSVDTFNECEQIDSCYRYRSQSACEQQDSHQSNNKCLPRDCAWNALTGDLDRGICFETVPDFMDCEFCNKAENNQIFDECTAQRCMQFGSCYPRRIDGMCVDVSDVSCQDYLTENECTGGSPVSVDVTYDNFLRIAGTNIVTPSNDAIGMGLCKWDPDIFPGCYKDADGDSSPDPAPYDKTPPNSRVLTPQKVLTLNFTLETTDRDANGEGTGVHFTYICADDTAYCYPTEKYVPVNGIVYEELGGGHGLHTVYYYSEDYSHNLELVKTAIIEIDRSPPMIDITAFPVLDLDNFVDSSVVFVVTLSENATCVDNFEGANPKITYLYGAHWVVEYRGLTDGIYVYKVNCTDPLGNTGVAYYDLRIYADGMLFDPKPQGVIDYSPVELGVSTLTNVPCKFGETEADYSRLPFNFAPAISVSDYFYHAYSYDLFNNGTYSFDVKCDLGNRISDDEIQFVYDIKPPETIVLDENNEPFDFTKWYKGVKDKVFLGCSDQPEHGFGCDQTYYCVADAMCTPTTLSDPLYPLEYDLTQTSDTWLCYFSTENTLNNMGGSVEETVCRQIKLDHYPPLLTIDQIEYHNTADNPFATVDDTYVLRGNVNDMDAGAGQDNTVRIIVVDSTGAETEYTDISANRDFAQRISLNDGLNTVTVIATDRSGQTDTKTVYITVAEISGAKIVLVKPNKYGVSPTRIFDLQVMTYKDSECRFSINNAQFDRSGPMILLREPNGDNYDYYHTKEEFQLGFLSEVNEPVYIKCRDTKGVIFEQVFNLSWDDTAPSIEEILLQNSDARTPPTLVEFPLASNISVETDDPTRCKYSETMLSYACCMDKFDGFDEQYLYSINKQYFGSLQDQSSYDYFFQCENGAGLVSDRMSFSFEVDTTKATGFTFLSPPRVSSNTSVLLKLRTTKSTTDCKYGITAADIPMTPIDDKTHQVQFTLSEGEYTYMFQCTTFDSRITDTYSFAIDNSPPSIPVIDDGNATWYLFKLSAKWESTDNLSRVTEYNYSIGSSPGTADIFDWHVTTKDRMTVYGLNLTNSSTYYWSVKAKNGVGLWSNAGHSDGVYVNTVTGWTNYTEPPPLVTPDPISTCYNGIKDDNETDVDCGGVCLKCTAGYACLENSDCESYNCQDNVCAEPTCTDGVLNQDESDVDCGGRCDPCAEGSTCVYDSDCDTEFCNNEGKCAVPTCYDGEQNGDEEGVDCGGSCAEDCPDVVDPDGCKVSGQTDTDCDSMPDWWENQYTPTLNTEYDDADEDPDKDGFSNYEEFINGTDPTVADKGESKFWIWLLVIIMLVILGGGSYLGYEEYVKKKTPVPAPKRGPMQQKARHGIPGRTIRSKVKTPQQKYIDSLGRMIRNKRRGIKQKDRKSLMSAFDDSSDGKSGKPPVKPGAKPPVKPGVKPPKPPTKPAAKSAKPVVADIKPPKPPTPPGKQPKAISDLASIAGDKKTDAFAELSKIAKPSIKKPTKPPAPKKPLPKKPLPKKPIPKKAPVTKKPVKKSIKSAKPKK